MEENSKELEQLEGRIKWLIKELGEDDKTGFIFSKRSGCQKCWDLIKPLISSMLQAKDEKIASLTKLIEDIKEMNKILIGKLSAEIRMNNEEISSLQSQLQEKDSEIAQLKKELEDKKAVG